jgi:hypothetical protein
MIPSDEPPNGFDNNTEFSFSTLEECDYLVQAFREFLIAEISSRGKNQIAEIVANFSRRVTFLTQHLGLDLQDDDTSSLLLGLSDAKMASLALEAVQYRARSDRLLQHLASLPYPHYEADPKYRDLIVRIEENGSRTSGRFVDNAFVAAGNE